jgi:hypothetical protein
MRKKEKKQEEQQQNTIIEITEEVRVGDTILEPGDKVEVLNEYFGPEGIMEFENLVKKSDSSWRDVIRYILTEASNETTREMLEVTRDGINNGYI